MWLGLGGKLALAVVVAAVVTWLGLRALHVREFKPEQQLPAATLYDLLKVAFGPAEEAGGRWLRAGNARSPSAGTTPGSSPQATAR